MFLPLCVIYCAMTFYYFLCYCIIFLHTYPYKHVHMLCFFLFLFLNCLILWCFPYFIYYYLDASGSPDAQFSYHEARDAWCVSTVHSSLTLCCPLCTLKRLLSQSFLCCGSSVLKALPTCLYVERSRRLDSPRMSCCHSLPWQFLYRSVGLDSISSQVRGTKDSGRWPPPLLKTKEKKHKRGRKKTHMAPSQSITCNRRVIFYMRSSVECVCNVSKKPIFGFRRLYCWTTSAFPHSGVCLLYFCCSSSDALVLLQIFYDAKMLAFWMGLPEFFFTW